MKFVDKLNDILMVLATIIEQGLLDTFYFMNPRNILAIQLIY